MRYLSHTEATIINKLIDDILSRGLLISVQDGEEWAVKRSTDPDEIKRDIGETCETQIVCRDPDGTFRGWFWLIHGNDEDVISDHTDNEICHEICKSVGG